VAQSSGQQLEELSRGVESAFDWAHAEVDPWTIASWMLNTQPDVGGRTPRQALLDGDAAEVETLARQASERLAF
jgi:hypothetical protein